MANGVVNAYLDLLVTGADPITVETDKVSMTVAKVSVSDFKGRTYLQAGGNDLVMGAVSAPGEDSNSTKALIITVSVSFFLIDINILA